MKVVRFVEKLLPNVTDVCARMRCVKVLVYYYQKKLHYVLTKVRCMHDARTFYTVYVATVTSPPRETSVPTPGPRWHSIAANEKQQMKRKKLFS
jgi:hypothetical protein